MGELQALKGKLGLRAFKQLRRAAEGSAGGSSGSRDAERRSKNSPMVQSSKKPVSMIRDTVAPLRAVRAFSLFGSLTPFDNSEHVTHALRRRAGT